jgi:hypothetical protein
MTLSATALFLLMRRSCAERLLKPPFVFLAASRSRSPHAGTCSGTVATFKGAV